MKHVKLFENWEEENNGLQAVDVMIFSPENLPTLEDLESHNLTVAEFEDGNPMADEHGMTLIGSLEDLHNFVEAHPGLVMTGARYSVRPGGIVNRN
jgi:hypothetical protein